MEGIKVAGAIVISMFFGLCFYFGNDLNQAIVVSLAMYYGLKSWLEV